MERLTQSVAAPRSNSIWRRQCWQGGEVLVIGGSGGWRRRAKAWPHRADNGVRLSEVVASLAAEVGETAVLEPGAERILGYAWARHEGPAATALEDLERK